MCCAKVKQPCCAKVKRTPKGALAPRMLRILDIGLQRSHAGVGRAKLVGEADLTTLIGK